MLPSLHLLFLTRSTCDNAQKNIKEKIRWIISTHRVHELRNNKISQETAEEWCERESKKKSLSVKFRHTHKTYKYKIQHSLRSPHVLNSTYCIPLTRLLTFHILKLNFNSITALSVSARVEKVFYMYLRRSHFIFSSFYEQKGIHNSIEKFSRDIEIGKKTRREYTYRTAYTHSHIIYLLNVKSILQLVICIRASRRVAHAHAQLTLS